MIFISTGGIRDKTAAETAQDFHRHGITAVELSGGAYSATLEADLRAMRKDLVFQVHNYFRRRRNRLSSTWPRSTGLFQREACSMCDRPCGWR